MSGAYAIKFSFPFLCARFLSRVADPEFTSKQTLLLNRLVHSERLKNSHCLSKLNPKQCDSSNEDFCRESCKVETSPRYPAVSMAAAGGSNYSVGSPLGISESVSKRPEANDSCLPWAPGNQSPCRIKITCPRQHLLALDTCRITLLTAGNNRLMANY